MDLTRLPDADVDQLPIAVLTEQERRANLALILAQIEELREKYIAGGGHLAELP